MIKSPRLGRAVRFLLRRHHRSFAYSPLLNPTTEIRILELLPGINTEPIRCNLIHTDLFSQHPSYEALSYTWGTERPSFSLSINTCTNRSTTSTTSSVSQDAASFINIRPSLLAALYRLRTPSSSRFLWIDALCIDQSSIPERNAQVTLMLQICQTASRVIVWLGPAAHSSHLAMDPSGIMENMHALTSEMWDAELDHNSQRWEAFREFVARPWWRRTWVIQEVAVAREVMVICGAEEIKWEILARNLAELMVVMDSLEPEKAPMRVDDDVSGVAAFRTQYQDGQRTGLVEVLNRFRGWEATDHRDKVFGLLGITSEGEEQSASGHGEPIAVDYNLSTNNLYEAVARFCMREMNLGFKIMGLVDPPSKKRRKGLASWAPDWTGSIYQPSGEPYYRLSTGAEPQVKFLSNPPRLIVQVYLLGEIGSMERWPPFRTSKAGLQAVEELFVNMRESLCFFYTHEKSCRAAYRRTLIADTIDNTRPSIEDLERYFAWFGLPDYEPEKQVETLDAPQGGEVKEITAEEFSRLLPEFLADGAHRRAIHRDRTREEEDRRFFQAIATAGRGRDLFLSRNGFMGMAVKGFRDGDRLCLPVGGDAPWLVRPSRSGTYTFVGECYVHGTMDEEATMPVDSLSELFLV
ncbi:Heterokaryon incompatibility protein (HET) domain containing protein [Rhypophila sp. PSN 637]